MAKRQALFDDLMELGSKLPWQVTVLSAVGTFLVLHFIAVATSAPATATTLSSLGSAVQHQFVHTMAVFSQYLLPAGLLIGAFAGLLKHSQAKPLLNGARTNPKNIAEMSWREFERLIGEAFRQRGYTVTGFGSGGPDGGVDLALVKSGERFLVQCKHWRAQQVGVTVVRELNGVIAAIRAHGGFVVTGGKFTQEAREFAQKTRIELMDGNRLARLTSRKG